MDSHTSPFSDGPGVLLSEAGTAQNLHDAGRELAVHLALAHPGQAHAAIRFDNLLHWFAPKGQDVMEVYATDSTTGEKTQIKSFDDYLAWREAHPEEVKKYE